MATTAPASPSLLERPDVPPGQLPRSRPVLFWAALGVGQLALAAYCIVKWGTSGQMRATPPGPDEMAAWKTAVMWALQTLGPVAAVVIVYLTVVRPWRRDGRPSSDGMLVIAYFAIAIPHDILLDLVSPSFSYNAHYINAGSWLGQVPGALIPNGDRVLEPLILVLPAYGWCVFLPSVLGCIIMRRAAQRWPRLRTGGLVGVTLLFFIALDFVFEMAIILADVEKYTGTVRSLTLWAGTNHQFPLHEPVLWAAFWTGCSALRFFRDDRGLTFAERGVSELQLSQRGTMVVRQLALIGVATAAITVLYNLPWWMMSAHNDSYPQRLPSYFGNQVCTVDDTAVTAKLPPCPRPGPLPRRS